MIQVQPDVLLVDIQMPRMDGPELVREMRKRSLPGEVIFLTMFREEEMFNEAMDLGVKGYVLKESAIADVLASIGAVLMGRHFISPDLSNFLVARGAASDRLREEKPEIERLTPTERKILRLVATDRTSKEIAGDLELSPHTVENHRNNISSKLGLRGSHSLLRFAFANRSRL